MVQTGEGTGTLVPTGRSEPARGVNYAISHEATELKGPGGQTVELKKAIVHRICCQNGETIPAGDFDLVVGSDLLRVKHVPQHPEWLVLSSDS